MIFFLLLAIGFSKAQLFISQPVTDFESFIYNVCYYIISYFWDFSQLMKAIWRIRDNLLPVSIACKNVEQLIIWYVYWLAQYGESSISWLQHCGREGHG